MPLDRARRWTALLFLVPPLALTLSFALRVDCVKPLWFDEWIVADASSQPHLKDLWNILASGQSPHPPLNFLVVRTLYAVFGKSELVTRLPSTVGFAAMQVCLFFFVSKRANRAFGTVAMLVPLAAFARQYSFEAKPYGVLLGWTGAALLCWRYTEAARRRPFALAGLSVSLACATCTHFFGVLLWVPVLAGEAARTFARRRVDWLTAAAISCSVWPLLVLAPLLRAGSHIHGAHPWQAPPDLRFPFQSLDQMLAGAAVPILICFLVAAASKHIATRRPPPLAIPLPEMAAAGALALLPFAAICGLRLAGIRAVEVKYVIPMAAGIAILFSWGTYSISSQTTAAGIALSAILACWSGRDFLRDLHAAQHARTRLADFTAPVAALPIVVDTTLYTMLSRYAPPDVRRRMYFLLDPAGQLGYIGSDALHLSMALNPAFFGEHVEPLAAFETEHREFLIYERSPDDLSWLLRKFRDEGDVRIELLAAGSDDRWYLVKLEK
jgi:hypothetical protein